MDINEIENGINVIIADSINITDRRHSICSDMMDMRGQMFIVDEVNRVSNCVHIKGYTWAPEDIHPVVIPEVEPIIFHFDPQYL